MFKLRRIRRPPPNFHAYIEEVARGLEGLYGLRAAQEYAKTAHTRVAASMKNPAVDAIAACDAADAAGLLMAVAREEGVGEIVFIHVLAEYAGQGVEQRLMRESVQTFRAAGVDGILCESVVLCPLDLDATFAALGFAKVERLLMAAPADAPGLQVDGPSQSAPCRASDWAEVADVLVDAHRDHPGRRLHAEVRDPASASNFLTRVLAGGYGRVRPDFMRVIRVEGVCAGTVIGCQIAADVGFVLYLVVRPAYQGRGIGTRLLREAAQAFRDAAVERIALGVTASDPAVRLYARLGFAPLRPINAYVWRRPGAFV